MAKQSLPKIKAVMYDKYRDELFLIELKYVWIFPLSLFGRIGTL